MKTASNLLLIETVDAMQGWRCKQESSTVGFVPTMGALHEGHMSLVRRAKQECQSVVVSIFVNPLQFGPAEDFNKYPRPLEKDLQFCRQAGVEAVFHPTPAVMYPSGEDGTTKVIPPQHLINSLCGAFRPGHFEGVATVCAKLFGIVQPHRAYFGEKDYQQLTVIRQMVKDLNMPLEVVPVTNVREPDGLAMSSRNVYLTAEQRALSPVLYQTLCFVRDEAVSGRLSLQEALEQGRRKLSELPGVTLQYLEACNPVTLEQLPEAAGNMVILVAAKFGGVRLIDNLIVGH